MSLSSRVIVQDLGRPGLGAERDVPALVERDEACGAPQVERRARADVHGEHGRERDQHDGHDQGDAALLHPGTSTRRLISPQSSSTTVISTASGRTVKLACDVLLNCGHSVIHSRPDVRYRISTRWT